VWVPLLTILGAGVVAAVLLAFWAELQNWMAGVIDRAEQVLGRHTHTLQSALVLLDRVMVNGQRMIALTGRVSFRKYGTTQITTKEEVRHIEVQALPAEILGKLDSGQNVSYELSNGETA
jgi:hypothetical protein